MKRLLGSKKDPAITLPGKEQKWIRSIQGSLSADLLKAPYKPEEADFELLTRGHCYVAVEAAYHLFASAAGYVPYAAKNPDGTTHWWLTMEDTGQVLDPTSPQLEGNYSIYEKGKRRAFLTTEPSKRAQELMRRVIAARERA